MKKFEFEAVDGGRICVQEGGYVFYGIYVPSGRDILEDAVKHFRENIEGSYPNDSGVDLPPFKLTIELMGGYKNG